MSKSNFRQLPGGGESNFSCCFPTFFTFRPWSLTFGPFSKLLLAAFRLPKSYFRWLSEPFGTAIKLLFCHPKSSFWQLAEVSKSNCRQLSGGGESNFCRFSQTFLTRRPWDLTVRPFSKVTFGSFWIPQKLLSGTF